MTEERRRRRAKDAIVTNSRTKNAQAASLGHRLEEIGIDRMTSSGFFGATEIPVFRFGARKLTATCIH